MKVLATFEHDGKAFEVRSYFDEQNQEHVARAYHNEKPVDGLVYTCQDETKQDMTNEKYEEMMIRVIKNDIETDRWAELVKLKIVNS